MYRQCTEVSQGHAELSSLGERLSRCLLPNSGTNGLWSVSILMFSQNIGREFLTSPSDSKSFFLNLSVSTLCL